MTKNTALAENVGDRLLVVSPKYNHGRGREFRKGEVLTVESFSSIRWEYGTQYHIHSFKEIQLPGNPEVAILPDEYLVIQSCFDCKPRVQELSDKSPDFADTYYCGLCDCMWDKRYDVLDMSKSWNKVQLHLNLSFSFDGLSDKENVYVDSTEFQVSADGKEISLIINLYNSKKGRFLNKVSGFASIQQVKEASMYIPIKHPLDNNEILKEGDVLRIADTQDLCLVNFVSSEEIEGTLINNRMLWRVNSERVINISPHKELTKGSLCLLDKVFCVRLSNVAPVSALAPLGLGTSIKIPRANNGLYEVLSMEQLNSSGNFNS
jgi:hypothetical protein